jgi:protein-S-isoprenylcysteine O-methyltransferase Ste14
MLTEHITFLFMFVSDNVHLHMFSMKKQANGTYYTNRSFMPYFYVFFLTILLFHRAKRDDVKCRLKYGKYWEEYCKTVPYKVIPGIY